MTMRMDISIGPVQGFVAQSRRTRDLWGSSYLLSFLSAHAMRGAKEAGASIIQPVDADPLYRWVLGHGGGEAPRTGTVPNRFVVKVDGAVQEVAEASIQAFMRAWERVHRAVWERFVAHAAPDGNGTRAIWKRQVDMFWEIAWTAGEADDGALLGRRKHWRSHRSPDEPGDKCTVMHDLQELSGYVRSGGSESRDQQDQFWRRVRDRLGPLDMRDNERLCAIALVKRLFPKVGVEALGWKVDTSHWPSTVYVGAVPWIRRVESIAPDKARQYAEAVREYASDVLAEHQPAFTGLDEAAAGDFPRLDANYFHRDQVKDGRLTPLADDESSGVRAELARLLQAIYDARDATRGRQLGRPPSFYALLLADGDRLGKLAGKLGRSLVSRKLSTFTDKVPAIVEQNDGVTIYAGGDDVLAMLPLPQALSCADSLSNCYRCAFDNAPEATLSAAIVFAQVRIPLLAVIREAHHLLDDVAKEANGRDSLAAAVLKPGGLNCQWVTTWNRTHPDGSSSRAAELLRSLTEHLGKCVGDPGLSSGLLYRIRDMLAMLGAWDRWEPGLWGGLPKGFDVQGLLRAEILRSLDGTTMESAETRVQELADLTWKTMVRARAGHIGDESQAGVDALLLARFLAGDGIEETSQ